MAGRSAHNRVWPGVAIVAVAVVAVLAVSQAFGSGPAAGVRAEAGDPVLLAAGDIASCVSTGDEATADLLDTLDGMIAALGDTVYENGTPTEFTNCYAPSWGRHLARTRPAVGNHEYGTAGAAGYFAYFGAAAGDPAKGYYSYDLGAWHIVVINSNCASIGGCGAGSAQEMWLRADLSAHPAECTLAYWHHPLFSSGEHGNTTAMRPIFQALYDGGAEIVLAGHEHDYERFAAQAPDAATDSTFGIREFVVGTGGRSLRTFGTPKPNSEVRDASGYGVLELTLHASGYDWTFRPVEGETFTDSGSGVCHLPPPEASLDSDGDGCTDLRELRDNHTLGGQRSPSDPYDFFDVPIPYSPAPTSVGLNRAINAQDVLAVRDASGTLNGFPGYNAQYDRTPTGDPSRPWLSRAPSGAVNAQDVLVSRDSTGDVCA